MPLTREMMREAGSKAFFALKKYKLYESKTEGSLTTLSLFGDTYRFFFDSERKIAWMRSKHHYQQSSNFKLSTRHKEWEGIFSYPRSVVYEEMKKILDAQGVEVKGPDDSKKLGTECRIVACQAYNADKRKLGRIFGGVIWKHYDHEIASLAMKTYGLTSSALDYSIIANNKEEFLDTLQKAPGILPIWRDLVLVKMFRDRKPIPPPPPTPQEVEEGDELEREFLALLDGVDYQPRPNRPGIAQRQRYANLRAEADVNVDHPGHLASSFNFPEEATTFVFPDIIKMVKTHLDNIGLTSAGWRYLLKLSPRSVQMIINFTGGRDLVPLLNWLAAVGVVPRYSLIKPILRNTMIICKTDDFTAVMRAGLLHAQKMRTGVRSFFDNQMHLVLDWFDKAGPARTVEISEQFYGRGGVGVATRQCNQVPLDNNQRKASWDWFMRQQEAWHRDAAAREAVRVREEAAKLKGKSNNESWESALPTEFVLKGAVNGKIQDKYRVIPLTSTYALIDEGKDMHHCVASYARNCLDGLSRIFSIRGINGEKLATLELRNEAVYRVNYPGEKPKGWVVNQCRGVCNDSVSDDVKSVAQKIAKKYNQAIGIGGHFAQQEEAIAV